MLNAAFVRYGAPPGVHGDGRGSRGLSLRVVKMTNGRFSKTWRQRLRINGVSRTLTIGRYPDFSLAEAREIAFQNARTLAHGDDPRNDGIPTFETVALEALEQRVFKAGTRTREKWLSELSTYAFPHLGKMPVDTITTADVFAMLMLKKRWTRKHPTMQRVRQHCSAVLRYAEGKGFRSDDPAGAALKAVLPPVNHQSQRQKAITPDEAPAAFQAVLEPRRGLPAVRLSLAFLIATASRSEETREARWSEIDGNLWVVPAARTKTGQEHRVPLSDAAMRILAEAKRLYGSDGLVFPARNKIKPVSGEALCLLLRRIGIPAVPHGFRQTFRNWCAEQGDIAREIAEQCLSHRVRGVEAHYLTSDLLAQRERVFSAYGEYLTG